MNTIEAYEGTRQTMLIIPAIDLKGGKCVRLRQGEMSQETQYSDDPSSMALHWQRLGAQCLHIVDLDGAVEGQPQNLSHIEQIIASLTIPVQVGGGIRHLDTIRNYLSIGVERVILGTAVLEEPDLVARACEEFPGKILVGIDERKGYVATRGWTNVSEYPSEQVVASLSKYVLAGIVFTDISRDGMLTGPNLAALRHMARVSPFPVIASGGISKLEDIQAIKTLGSNIMGIIIGKALYEGTIDLPAALVASSSTPGETCLAG